MHNFSDAGVVVNDVPTSFYNHLDMSEPPPSESSLQDSSMVVDAGEKAELSQDIMNALRQLQTAPQFSPTPTPTQPNSQDSVAVKQEPTPPPQSEWDRLRAQLRDKPIDADAWLKLVDLAEDSGDIEKIKNTYEGMLETYPNTVRITVCTFVCDIPRLTVRISSPRFKLPT